MHAVGVVAGQPRPHLIELSDPIVGPEVRPSPEVIDRMWCFSQCQMIEYVGDCGERGC